MNVSGVTHCFLVGLKACFTGGNMSGTINLVKNPWLESSQALVGERKPTTNSSAK